MNTRHIISISVFAGFIMLAITGLMSYAFRYSQALSAVHTVLGLGFLLLAILHIRNNFRVLLNYLKNRFGKRVLWSACALIALACVGAFFKLPPVSYVADLSYAIKELRPIDRQVVETLYTKIDAPGRELTIEIKAGPHYTGPGAKVMGITTTGTPQIAVWLETEQGKFIDTLFVTKKAASGSYIAGLFSSEEIRRPEALPVWAHARGKLAEDGLFVPSKASPLVDAISGATPLSNFDLQTRVEADRFVIKLEANRSFDYNQFYHPDAFPADEIYSGSGNSAQPSVVYQAIVDFSDQSSYNIMQLIGRGHHSGIDGQIYADLENLTTAKQLFRRIIVEESQSTTM